MKRIASFVALAVAAVVAMAPLHAQDHNAELLLGASFALVSQEFDVEQDLGFAFRATWQASDRFGVGLIYETTSTVDDFGTDGDAEWSIFGLTGQYYLNDEEDFQLILLAALGQGEIDYTNPGPPSLIPEDTDIALWYELGGAANFVIGNKWMVRPQVTLRRIDPDQQSMLIDGVKTLIVPQVNFGIKF